jgi:hypothetical protein
MTEPVKPILTTDIPLPLRTGRKAAGRTAPAKHHS